MKLLRHRLRLVKGSYHARARAIGPFFRRLNQAADVTQAAPEPMVGKLVAFGPFERQRLSESHHHPALPRPCAETHCATL